MIAEKLWPTFYRVSRSTALRLSVLAASILALGLGILASEPPQLACRQRGEAYQARVAQLKKDAHEKLRIGTREDAVNEFFEAHGLPFNVFRSGNHKEGVGTIQVQGGCAPRGCGSEDALIGLRVELSLDGTVIAEPVVGAQFTNCL